MKITIIGAGNMGGATAIGFSRFCKDCALTVTAAHAQTLKKYAALGMETSLDNAAAASGADIIVLGVKPWLVESVLESIRPALKGKLLLSLAAGIPSGTMASYLNGAGVTGLYTVIPNLAIEMGESMTFIHEIEGTASTRQTVMKLFESVGKALIVKEKQLNAGMMVASCGTAFALRYARAATEGGVALGLYPAQALEAVLQTLKGAARLVEAHKTHPEEEIDRVTTPGGITIRGLNAMEEAGFTNAVLQGLLRPLKD